MWESRRLWARFPRDSWKGWEACLWLSMLSTASAFPRLSSDTPALAVSLAPPLTVGYGSPESFFLLLFFSR
jgi:hypothetical protein